MSFFWEYIEFGDVEAACIKVLMTTPELTDYPGDTPRISGDLVGYQMGDRWIKVVRAGGIIKWPKIDSPRIDFHVFAETRSVAHDLAQIAQAAMFRSMDQAFPEFGLRLTNVKLETGLLRMPDKETGSERYLFSLRLTCVPI